MKTKVINIDSDFIYFENGIKLFSNHESDCCESHDLYMGDLTMKDFEGLEFDLSTDTFFTKIEGYGIELNPISGYPVKIPGHGSNNGYYSTNLTLYLSGEGFEKTFDITECQEISD